MICGQGVKVGFLPTMVGSSWVEALTRLPIVDRAIVAPNVSPVAFIVSPDPPSVRFNVSRKRALFAISPADVCEPLHLPRLSRLRQRYPYVFEISRIASITVAGSADVPAAVLWQVTVLYEKLRDGFDRLERHFDATNARLDDLDRLLVGW